MKSFRSSDRKSSAGIEFGAEWYSEIMGKITDATDVVVLLTPHSIDRPWILYEAGVAKGLYEAGVAQGKLGTPVFGVVIGAAFEQATRGPFAQFHNSGADEDSLTRLVMQLIERNPAAAPRAEAVRRHVTAFREDIKQLAGSNKDEKPATPAAAEATSVAKLFEEIKLMFRGIQESNSPRATVSIPFVSESQIEEIELAVKGQVIVVTRDLKFDTRILDVVQKNARRGIKYVYLMPAEGMNQLIATSFLAEDPEARKNLEFHSLGPEDFHFPLDMVVYDPGEERRNGYLCLPIDSSTLMPKRILISGNQSLKTAAASLTSLIESLRKRNKTRSPAKRK